MRWSIALFWIKTKILSGISVIVLIIGLTMLLTNRVTEGCCFVVASSFFGAASVYLLPIRIDNASVLKYDVFSVSIDDLRMLVDEMCSVYLYVDKLQFVFQDKSVEQRLYSYRDIVSIESDVDAVRLVFSDSTVFILHFVSVLQRCAFLDVISDGRISRNELHSV